jgi:hypothetical protein
MSEYPNLLRARRKKMYVNKENRSFQNEVSVAHIKICRTFLNQIKERFEECNLDGSVHVIVSNSVRRNKNRLVIVY